jgi:hypothetical protein
MKNFALKGDGLKYEDYHPEIKGIKIPQLWMIFINLFKNILKT